MVILKIDAYYEQRMTPKVALPSLYAVEGDN